MAIHQFQSPDFSLRQLQYAVAIAEAGSFGGAATLCGVSQPSLSAQVAKLESVLGARLFQRNARGVRLSPAGERLLPVFRDALNAGAAVEVAAATLQDPYAIPVRIAVIPTVAPYLLPTVTRHLTAHPGPTVHWLELQTATAEEALAAGKVDAILIADPPTAPGLHVEDIGWEPFVVAVPASLPAPAAVPMPWLHSQEVLLLDEGHCLRDQTLSLCMLPETQQSPFRATSLGTLVQMIASGFGSSVLPAMAVEVEKGRADIQIRPFRSPGIGRQLRLISPPGHPMSQALGELADRLRHAMQAVEERVQQLESDT